VGLLFGEIKMEVFILTHGRATGAQQHTAAALLDAGIAFKYAVQESELPKWSWCSAEIVVLPPHIKDVSATRDYLVHDVGGDAHIFMFDDDLRFAARRDDDATKFTPATSADLFSALERVNINLSINPMVGLGAREGGNRVTDQWVYETRIMRAFGLNRNYLRRHEITFAPLKLMEDFHVNLQILESGKTTSVYNLLVTDQVGGSNSAGGCSTYRTPELQEASANLLAARHPGVVKVVKKTTKGAWGGGTRTDVIVQWKQAAKFARNRV
jgi:hypothetical protein